MDKNNAISIIEGFTIATSQDEVVEAFQFLIDSDLIWQLHESTSAAARQLIVSGICRESYKKDMH